MKMFAKIPNLLTDEELIALYPKLRAGDPDAKRKVIEGNMAQALYIANSPREIHLRVGKYQEMVAEAMYQLIVAVENIIKYGLDHHETINIRGYITFCIRKALKKHHYRDRLFAIDPATYAKLQKQGVQFEGMVTMHKIEKPVGNDISEELAIKELIEKTILTEREKEIYQSRLRNEDDVEIAKRLGISKQAVHQTRTRLKERILEKLR